MEELDRNNRVVGQKNSFYTQPSGVSMKLEFLRWKFCSQDGESDRYPRGEPYVLFGQDYDWTRIAESVLLLLTPTYNLKDAFSDDWEKLVRNMYMKPEALDRRNEGTNIGARN